MNLSLVSQATPLARETSQLHSMGPKAYTHGIYKTFANESRWQLLKKLLAHTCTCSWQKPTCRETKVERQNIPFSAAMIFGSQELLFLSFSAVSQSYAFLLILSFLYLFPSTQLITYIQIQCIIAMQRKTMTHYSHFLTCDIFEHAQSLSNMRYI